MNATIRKTSALQATVQHPAPCARHCEANAFEIRRLKGELAAARAGANAGVREASALDGIERHTWASIAERMIGKYRDESNTEYVTLADAEAAVSAALATTTKAQDE